MKKYYSLYKQLNKINLSLFLAYRINFINEFIATSVWTGLIVSTMLLLTRRATVVAGWNQGEMLLLTASIIMILGIFEIHFKRSFQLLPTTIFKGDLDNLLLKPVDSQFMVSFISFKLMGLWRFLIGVIFLWYVLHTYHIHYTFANAVSYAVLLFVGSIIYYTLWFVVSTFLIWNPRLSNLLDVMNSMNHASRFPPDMYREFHTVLFFVLLPYMVLVSTPVKVFLGKAGYQDIISLLVLAVGMFVISRMFWKFSLRYYTSASR